MRKKRTKSLAEDWEKNAHSDSDQQLNNCLYAIVLLSLTEMKFCGNWELRRADNLERS